MIHAAAIHLSSNTPALDSLATVSSADQIGARDLVAIPAELKARALAYQVEAAGLKVMRDVMETILRKMGS